MLGTFDAGALGEAARDLAIVDVATAQELLDRIGALDRVQLRLDAIGERTVQAALEPGERLERPATRGRRVASMMDAFRVNMLALGALALVVGSLLVFNAAQFVVVRRRPLLGQLRCLGATRRAVILAVVGESLFIGIAGGLLGVAAGGALAQGLVGSIAQTVSELYAFVQVDVAPIPTAAWFVGPLFAGAVAALASLWPAIDAGRTAPKEVGARSRTESRYRAGLPILVGCAVACGLIAVGLLVWPTRAWWPGIAAALLVLAACALLLPPLMGGLLGVLARVGDRVGLLSMPLAAGALSRSLARAGGAAAALGVALAMAIAVIVMIASFRAEVDDWVRAALTADLYVSDPHDREGAGMGRVPDDVIERIARHPGVRAVERRRFAEAPLGSRSILVIGTELPVRESAERFRILVGDPERAWSAVRAGAVLVSEPLASHHAVGPGDTIAIATRRGTESIEVAAVVRDFSVDRGYALMDDAAFVRRFGDPGVRNVAVYLRDPTSAQRVATEVRRSLPPDRIVTVRSNAELRARVFEVFEETFKVTRVLQVIAIAIALVGIALTLGALYLERGREIATLRAVGASLRRVTGIFLAESVLLSLFPALLALPLGGWLAWILVHVINYRSFGWTLSMHWPVGAVLATCAGAVAAGAAAAVIPWWWARRDRLASGLREA